MRLALLAVCLPALALDNAVRITDTTASQQTSRPFSISRVFAQGEIAAFAQPFVDGSSPAAWQCDRKTTWADGSLQHAIISFKATVNASATIVVDFRNNANPCSSGDQTACNSASLDQTGILNFDAGGGAGSWGAVLEATQGNTVTTNARTMITAGRWSYWLRGPVVTQILSEDSTSARADDFGWTCTANCTGTYSTATWSSDVTNKSLHPRFVLTFYAGWSGVRVQPMIENNWTTLLQDQKYSLVVKKHNSVTVTSIAEFVQYSRTRRAKAIDFWEGTQPGNVRADWNLNYLVYSKVVPPYDTSRVVGTSAVALENTNYASKDCTFNGACQFQKSFNATGGRGEVGLLPRWDVKFLYVLSDSANYSTMEAIWRANADVSMWIPMHFRESATGRFFVDLDGDGAASDDGVDAFNRVVSADARPAFVSRDLTQGSAPDKLTPLATLSTSHGWTLDMAHESAFSVLAYILTGELYYLEEFQMWSAWNLRHSTSGNCDYCAHADWAYFNQSSAQVRGRGWGMRNLAYAAFFSPDSGNEKTYFRQKLQYNVAVAEGLANLTNGTYYDAATTSKWYWGRNTVGYGEANAFAYQPRPNELATEASVDSTAPNGACTVNGLFQNHYNWLSNAMALRLGFTEIGPLVESAARLIYSQIKDTGFDPYLSAAYMLPVTNKTVNCASTSPLPQNYFPTMTAMYNAFTASTRSGAKGSFNSRASDPENGYTASAVAVAAMHFNYTWNGWTGSSVWDWFMGNWPERHRYGSNIANCGTLGLTITGCDNPKFALVPERQITNIRVAQGSTTATVRFTAPDGAACSYVNATAVQASTLDSGDTAIAEGNRERVINLSSLTGATSYTTRITCGNARTSVTWSTL